MIDPLPPKPAGRGLVALALAGFALLLGLLAWPIFIGGVYTADDLAYLCIPYRYYYAEALKAGDSFLWTPQLFCGFYLQGDGQAGMCHPLHWVLYRWLPLTWAFNLEFLLAYVWMLPGMALLLGRLGLSRAAALVGGLIFTFCGFNIFHFMHMHAVAILSNLPWLLLAMDVTLTSPRRRTAVVAAAAVALLTASQFLTGYPQYMVFTLMAEVAFVLWRLRCRAHTWRVAVIVAALALGLAMGSVQVLPTYEALKTTSRGAGGLSYHLAFSMHPLNLVQLVSPFAFKDRYYATTRWFDGNTHEMGLYLGAFATVALAWLWIRRKELGAWAGLTKAAVVFALVALVLAMGKYGGLYYITSQLPVLSSLPLRCPTRHIILVHLALATLSGVALADLLRVLRSGEPMPWRSLKPLAVPVALSAVVLAAVAIIRAENDPKWIGEVGSLGMTFLGFLAIAAAAAFIVAAARGMKWGVYAIVGLVVVEAALGGVMGRVWESPPRTIDALAHEISLPPSTPKGHLAYPPDPNQNLLTLNGPDYKILDGYVALLPKNRIDMQSSLSIGLAQVDWIWTDKGWAPFTNSVPRARLVGVAVPEDTPLLDASKIDFLRMAVVDLPVDLGGGERGTATVTTDRPGWIEVTTLSPARQLLTVSEHYDAGWHATVDGVPAPVIRTNVMFLGCAVEPGEHKVRFDFMPSGFVWGRRIALAGLALTLIGLVVGLAWPGSKTPPPAAPPPEPPAAGSARDRKGSPEMSHKKKSATREKPPASDPGRLALLGRLELGVALGLTAFIVLLHGVVLFSAGPLWRDEINTVNLAALPTLGQVWDKLQFDSFPMVWFLVLRAWGAIGLAGTDLGLRVLGLLVGLGIVGLLWVTARRLGRTVPLVALVLVGLCPTMFRHGDSLRGYGAGVLVLLVLMAAFWDLLERLTWRRALLAALAALLTVQCSYHDSVFIFAMGVAAATVCVVRRSWGTLAVLAAIGLGSAASLLPYLPSMDQMQSWNMLLKAPITVDWLRLKFGEAVAYPGPFMLPFWTALVVLAVGACLWRIVRPKPDAPPLERDRALFIGITIVVGLVAYTLFLKSLSYPTQVWYYLWIMALLGVTIDAALALLVGSVAWRRWVRLGGVVALGTAMLITAWPEAQCRQTDLDLVGAKLEKLAGPDDLIVVDPWYMGLGMARYYHGSAPWVSIPEVTDFQTHRYDQVKAKMMEPDAIAPVLQRIAKTLQTGHRVWVVGDLAWVPQGEQPLVLPPAPHPITGLQEGPYTLSWSSQAAYFLQSHLGRIQLVTPKTNGAVNRFENPPLLVIDGWH
jgi:hypothetical protein